jgi:3-phosphoshikimate 1-carboxyvinyltransferase
MVIDEVPSSKSQTMRALVFAALARGSSTIENRLESPDVDWMIEACRQWGASVEVSGRELRVVGRGIVDQRRFLNAGNSGQVLRFGAAISALSKGETEVDGDQSIRTRRPVAPLIEGLRALGATVKGERPPFVVQGPLTKRLARIDGRDSQPVSALLMAGAFSPEGLELKVEQPGEIPWVKLTLSWLDRFHLPYEQEGFSHFCLPGGASIDGFSYRVPTDFSSLAACVTLALVKQEELLVENIEDDPHQGDRRFLEVVQEMGATCRLERGRLRVVPGRLKGIAIDINPIIDMAPLLAVLGCFAEGKTRLYNGKIARFKESDRLSCMTRELGKLGGRVQEFDEGLEIETSELKSAALESHDDHRIAIALAIALKGAHKIKEDPCIKKSYPGFCRLF